MPYDPGVKFDASPITQGMRDLGRGVQGFLENKRKDDAADAALVYLHQQHPDILPEADLEAIGSKNAGAKEGLLGQATAEILNRYKQGNLDVAKDAANLD